MYYLSQRRREFIIRHRIGLVEHLPSHWWYTSRPGAVVCSQRRHYRHISLGWCAMCSRHSAGPCSLHRRVPRHCPHTTDEGGRFFTHTNRDCRRFTHTHYVGRVDAASRTPASLRLSVGGRCFNLRGGEGCCFTQRLCDFCCSKYFDPMIHILNKSCCCTHRQSYQRYSFVYLKKLFFKLSLTILPASNIHTDVVYCNVI